MLLGVFKPSHVHQYESDPAYRVEYLCERPDEAAPPAEHEKAQDVAVARLRDLLKCHTPGVVVGMQLFALKHLHMAGAQGWRTIAQYHSTVFSPLGRRDAPRLKAWARDCDRCLLLTHEDADEVRRFGLNNTDVMRNPVGMDPDCSALLTSKTVTYAGRYHVEKSPDYLIRGWSRIADQFPDWRLELHGNGPEEGNYRKLVSELRIEGSVTLNGPTADMEQVLLLSSVFALTSQYEGLPMTVLEAMACGVPSVAFDCSPGVRSLIRDGENGRLVRQNSEEDLARALSQVMSDADLRTRLGQQARRDAATFSPGLVLDSWEELFGRVMR
jgi:glycosyltransferase involved in cell wall biosynthesis